MRLSDGELRGRTVIASDGVAVGEIDALNLDSGTWAVDTLRVKLRKDIADRIGAGRSVFHAATVELPTRMVQSVADAVLLTVSVDGLRQLLPAEERAPAH